MTEDSWNNGRTFLEKKEDSQKRTEDSWRNKEFLWNMRFLRKDEF